MYPPSWTWTHRIGRKLKFALWPTLVPFGIAGPTRPKWGTSKASESGQCTLAYFSELSSTLWCSSGQLRYTVSYFPELGHSEYAENENLYFGPLWNSETYVVEVGYLEYIENCRVYFGLLSELWSTLWYTCSKLRYNVSFFLNVHTSNR